MHGTYRALPPLVTRVLALLALAILIGAPAATGTARAGDCGYASIDQGGGASGGDNWAVAGDGAHCHAGPTHRPKPPPRPGPPPTSPSPPASSPPPRSATPKPAVQKPVVPESTPAPASSPTPTPRAPAPAPPAAKPEPKPKPTPSRTTEKPQPVTYPSYRAQPRKSPPRNGPSIVTLTLLITAPAVLAAAALRPR
ncbi:hypothetical protein AB0I16_25550 [Streptomyces sp. NPDC050703]|uniref:hypothetical protein n=1 Tax=Streptomyces sp. NPDC050703 TaxID=3157218 RepID=UPI00343A6231